MKLIIIQCQLIEFVFTNISNLHLYLSIEFQHKIFLIFFNFLKELFTIHVKKVSTSLPTFIIIRKYCYKIRQVTNTWYEQLRYLGHRKCHSIKHITFPKSHQTQEMIEKLCSSFSSEVRGPWRLNSTSGTNGKLSYFRLARSLTHPEPHFLSCYSPYSLSTRLMRKALRENSRYRVLYFKEIQILSDIEVRRAESERATCGEGIGRGEGWVRSGRHQGTENDRIRWYGWERGWGGGESWHKGIAEPIG